MTRTAERGDLDLMLREEMQLSERIAEKGLEFLPRFRIVTPEGEYQVIVQLADDQLDRYARLKLLAAFMACKLASSYIVSGTSKEPHGIFSYAVSADGAWGLFRTVERDEGGTPTIGRSVTLSEDQCKPVFALLLPAQRATIDAETLELIQKAFSLGGEMEARLLH